jgi:hypothetical protein
LARRLRTQLRSRRISIVAVFALLLGLLDGVAAQVIQELAAVMEALLRRGWFWRNPNTVLQEHSCQAAALGGTLVAITVELGTYRPGAMSEKAAALASQRREVCARWLVPHNACQTVEDRCPNQIGRGGFKCRGPA